VEAGRTVKTPNYPKTMDAWTEWPLCSESREPSYDSGMNPFVFAALIVLILAVGLIYEYFGS
jgi:hypothetical protein